MKTVTLRGTGSVQTCTARPGEKEWLVTCNEKGAEQIRLWERDPIMKSLLGVLNGIRHILIPRKLLLSTDAPQSIADVPAGSGPLCCSELAWFCEGELEDLRTLHQQGMAVGTLWRAVARHLGKTFEPRNLGQSRSRDGAATERWRNLPNWNNGFSGVSVPPNLSAETVWRREPTDHSPAYTSGGAGPLYGRTVRRPRRGRFAPGASTGAELYRSAQHPFPHSLRPAPGTFFGRG